MSIALLVAIGGLTGVGVYLVTSRSLSRIVLGFSLLGHAAVLSLLTAGGSPGAETIRQLLVQGDGARWSAETEILLFTAARRDHLERTILPALEAGRTVITDRFADSTRIYQGATRGDLSAMVETLHSAAIGRDPDLTLILDLPVETALVRTAERGAGESRFEEMGQRFLEAVRAGFRALAEQHPERCVLVDADAPREVVAARVLQAVRARLA